MATNTHRSTPAEDTATILQQAAHGGRPAQIPGAFDMRAGRPSAIPVVAAVTPHARAAAATDTQRLEYQREGGGAPSQRPVGGSRTRIGRLWHRVLYGADPSRASRP